MKILFKTSIVAALLFAFNVNAKAPKCPDGETLTGMITVGSNIFFYCVDGNGSITGYYSTPTDGSGGFLNISGGAYTDATGSNTGGSGSGHVCIGTGCTHPSHTGGSGGTDQWGRTLPGTTIPGGSGSGTISGGVNPVVAACVQRCYSRWDGTSSRQARKRSQCITSCGGGIDVSASGGGGVNGNAGGNGNINISGNNNNVNCSYEYDYDACVNNDRHRRSRSSYEDCPDCVGGTREHWLSGLAEVVGAAAGPLAYFGSNYMWANAYLGGQQAMWGAVSNGYDQCTLQQQNYMTYLSSNQLPGLTPQDYSHLGCNNFGMNGFAGFGGGLSGNGYGGGGNPWLSAGYTPGFMGGMMGPYGGMMGPYGGMSGYPSGYGPGIGGGLYGNLGMGPFGNIGIGGGLGGGFNPYGGMNGGFNPYGGLNGGFNGGINGGFNPYGNGGFNGGINGGFNPYINGGLNGGLNTGMNYGPSQGVFPYNNGNGSYWNGSGGWNGGTNPYQYQQDLQYRQQANMYGNYYQQQSLMNNYYGAQGDLYGGGNNMYGNGYGYGNMYGNTPYWPGNMGASFNAGFNFGI